MVKVVTSNSSATSNILNLNFFLSLCELTSLRTSGDRFSKIEGHGKCKPRNAERVVFRQCACFFMAKDSQKSNGKENIKPGKERELCSVRV